MPERRRIELAAVAMVAIVVVTMARVAQVAALHDQGFFEKYLVIADRIAHGSIPRERLGDLSPGYLWLIVALRAWFGAGFAAIRTMQIAGVSLAAVFAGIVAVRLRGLTAGIAAVVFVLQSRAALVCATEAEPETLILVTGAAALMCFVEAIHRNGQSRIAWLVAAGASFGLSATARPAALLIVLALAVWLARPQGAPRARGIAAFAGAALLPVAIVVGANFALTGEAAIMDPGTVFYEGMNPLATGYAGVQPKIINDLEAKTTEPDALHLAYRYIASRAAGRALTRAESNRYWSGKALAFVRLYPGSALRLIGRKIGLTLMSHDSWDLSTMEAKSHELSREIWVPFGLLVVLSVAAFALAWRNGTMASILPPVLFAKAGGIVLIVFYVTARQRNAILPAMAVLAAVGVVDLAALLQDNLPRGVLAIALVAVSAVALGMHTNAQREDDHGWMAPQVAAYDRRFAQEEVRRGNVARARHHLAVAEIWSPGAVRNVPPMALRGAATDELRAAGDDDSRRFDCALALLRANALTEADSLLRELAKTRYAPRRENRTVSSLAYFRAVIAARRGSMRDAILLAAEAEQVAPGDPHVLALRV
ncbi:MAG TPA: glycosyltransferase family 39 protein, partial [Thermoanaerobaculia bacterium]|nr:glycosyltransferase family 39 protein [Thermoanaerobaculia bacterium]